MKKITLLLGVTVLLFSCAPEEVKTEKTMETLPSIVGAWELKEQNWSNDDTTGTNIPFKSIIMYSENYYSVEIAWEDRTNWADREEGEKATFNEYENAYNNLTSNSGSYEIIGDSLKRDLIVAKHPNFMNEEKTYTVAYKLDGDTLTTYYNLDDGYLVEFVQVRMK